MPSVEELAHAFASESAPPAAPPDVSFQWRPVLGPEQSKFYDSTARFNLAAGQRYSGKTWTALHKLVHNNWNHWNGHALIVVSVRRQATAGGAWHKLVTEILPAWCANQPGFTCTEPKQDAASKDLNLWHTNKYGGFSHVQLISVPYGHNLAERFRGIEVSTIFVDELTMMEDEGYLTVLMQQLGRRPHIPRAEQQYLAACNPTGPSSWVYKRFYEAKLEDGTPDPRYCAVNIPITDNPDPGAKDYYDTIIEATKSDPIEYRRLVLGEWIDRPNGSALFANHFFPLIHVKGDVSKNLLLTPKKGFPITIGWDPGDVNFGVVFLQERPVEDRRLWVVFDEVAITGKNTSFDQLVPMVMDKMHYWCEALEHNFAFQHISDNSAFNRFRSASGSYDHLQIQRISRELIESSAYPRLNKPIKFYECPKPPGSVAARIKMLWALLSNEEIFFSAGCQNLIRALANIESEEDEPFEPSRNGGHIHIYDALTYPLFYHALGKPPPIDQSNVAPSFGILKLGGRN